MTVPTHEPVRPEQALERPADPVNLSHLTEAIRHLTDGALCHLPYQTNAGRGEASSGCSPGGWAPYRIAARARKILFVRRAMPDDIQGRRSGENRLLAALPG